MNSIQSWAWPLPIAMPTPGPYRPNSIGTEAVVLRFAASGSV